MLFFAIALAAELPQLGPPANREPISAACMLEVVNSPAEREKLKQEAYREGAKKKVRVLSSLIADQLRLIEENRVLWPEVENEKRDLLDHGLITQQDWIKFQEGSPTKLIARVAERLQEWPACFMIERAPESPSKQMLIEAAAIN